MTSEFALYIVPKGSEYFEHDGTPTTYYCQSNTVGINFFKKVAADDFIVQVTDSGVMDYARKTGYDEYMGKVIAKWGGGQGAGGNTCVIESSLLQPYSLKWPDGSEVKPTDYFCVAKDTNVEEPASDGRRWGEHVLVKAARKYSGCITADDYVRACWRYGDGLDGKGPGFYFYWGDVKYVRFEDTTKGVAPAPKAPAVKVPTVRDYMIPKSKWEMTGSVNVEATKRVNVGGQQKYENYVYTTLHAGDVITIAGKFVRAYFGQGFIVPIQLADGTKQHILFNEIKDIVKQVGETEIIPEYFIFDTVEQKYYSGSEYHYDANHNRNDTITYAEKLTKARKFKRLGDVRAHVLVQSGYYDGLPGEGNLPDWMRGGKSFDVPETWEIHEINKLTKLVNRKIELLDTFKRTWRLRALTEQYGSAVRAVYSDLEKKKKLEEYSAILVFAKRESNNKYYDDFELTEAEKEEITESIANIDKKDIKSSKSYGAHAFAIKDASTGVMIRLCYSGDLECKVIDLQAMAEVVTETEVQS